MTVIQLVMPAAVLEQIEVPPPDERGAAVAVLAIESLGVVANLVTLTSLRPQLVTLSAAIRDWRTRQSTPAPIVLTAKGRGLDLTLTLSPNVSRATILDLLTQLADLDELDT